MTTVGERLVAQLTSLGVEAELIEPGAPMPTVSMAASAIGVAETSIIKSVLFEDRSGGVVLATARGNGRISRSALAEIVGADKLRLASLTVVLERTGFSAGGVAPVCHANSLPVVIDSDVMHEPWVYGGGGSEDTLLKMRPRDIVRVTNALIASIVDAGD